MVPMNGLQLVSSFEASADHYRYKWYDSTKDEVKILASSRVRKKTITYIAIPTMRVILMNKLFTPHPSNQINCKMIKVKFQPVNRTVRKIRVIPGQLHTFPPA